MFLSRNQTTTTKQNESNRNGILLSNAKAQSEIEGMPGMPNGPLVMSIRLFINENKITWMPKVANNKIILHCPQLSPLTRSKDQ